MFLPLREPSDTLEADFDAAPGMTLEVSGCGLSNGMENLVCRAAALYAETSGLSPRWRFRLEKRIPVASGLGGGSADAAAALRLLEGRFGAVGGEKLKELALKLGADVPFFLEPRPAVARGVGEELTFVAARELPLVLVNAGFPVSSKWAYRRFDECGAAASIGTLEGLLDALKKGDLEQVAHNVRNDLAPALWRKFPVLTLIRGELTARGALAVEVSGSGPTLFAVMPDLSSARRTAAELAERFPRGRSFAAEVLR